MTRGDVKRLLRAATRERIRLERGTLVQAMTSLEEIRGARHEEKEALHILQKVPSVFAIAEKINNRYVRPSWAMEQWGAK